MTVERSKRRSLLALTFIAKFFSSTVVFINSREFVLLHTYYQLVCVGKLAFDLQTLVTLASFNQSKSRDFLVNSKWHQLKIVEQFLITLVERSSDKS